MEKELIEALVAMRHALKAVMNDSIVVETVEGHTLERYNLSEGAINMASESDSKSEELLLALGVNPNDMPS